MFDVDINIWAVLAAGAAGWIAGAVWYGIFAKPWMALAHPGKKREDMGGAGVGYVVALVAYVIAAGALALVNEYYGVETLGDGMMVALLAFVGFVATTLCLNFTFSQRPIKLYLIDAGNYLVGFLVMGAILGAWL